MALSPKVTSVSFTAGVQVHQYGQARPLDLPFLETWVPYLPISLGVAPARERHSRYLNQVILRLGGVEIILATPAHEDPSISAVLSDAMHSLSTLLFALLRQ